VVQYMPRGAWTSWTPNPRDLVHLVDPRGIAVHWPGIDRALAPMAEQGDRIAGLLEAERRDHVERRGWSDIAYAAAIDQAGRVWDCRGWAWRPAANGDRTTNAQYSAVTLLVGIGEQPTEALLQAFRWWRHLLFLTRYPGARAVVGHRDLHATECPGDVIADLIRRGVLSQQWNTPTLSEDNMVTYVRPDDAHQPGDGILAVTPTGVYHVAGPQWAVLRDEQAADGQAISRAQWAALRAVAWPAPWQ